MLTMAQIQFIKHLRDVEDQSISHIAERVGINWRTAKKYADHTDWNQSKTPPQGKYPVMEPYREQVDTWLMEDRSLPKKQRHTAKRIYDRLVAEYGFTHSERTVRGYVAKRKVAIQLEQAKAYIRLEHPGGEAQVDFGTFQAVIGGKVVERKMLVLSYPYSNAAFVFVTPRENTECFLEGLRRLFEISGCVPTRIWFDNLSAAVVSFGANQNRRVTDAFERFSLHYRFESVFCNPASGNEKGHVENKVGYIRRNWCVPLPVADDAESLQQQLTQKAMEDLSRPHYAKSAIHLELWEEEKQKTLALPDIPYEVFRLEAMKTNGYGEITIDQQTQKIPSSRSGEQVWVRFWWDRMDILNEEYELLATFPRGYMDKPIPIDLVAYLRPLIQKPRALDYSSVLSFLSVHTKSFLQSVEGNVRKSRIEWLIRMLKTYQAEEIEQCLSQCPNQTVSHLEHFLYRLRHPEHPLLPLPETYTPFALVGYAPDLTKYDDLQRTEVR